ncbi:MAG: hypothetical protein ACI9XB_002186 [Gammaproteobacteria bacterium]|jgi:hypothetical protein
MRILCTCIFALFFFSASVFAQNGGRLSGSLEANANFFIRDSAIGAAGIPQYDKHLYGSESWMQLNYSNWGFDVGLRFDLYNNSNLIDPLTASNGQGIGRWYIKKKLDKFGISAGYLYDQIGSGIIFRAFEQRPLAIDNSLYGLRLTYQLTPDWELKAFSGKQRNIDAFVDEEFGGTPIFSTIVKGFSADGFISLGEEGAISLAPGFGVVNKTFSEATIDQVVGVLQTYRKEDQVKPQYNTYAFSLYNSLSYGKLNWYVEGAYKTKDVVEDPNLERFSLSGLPVLGGLTNNTGTVVYTSLAYASKKIGVTLEGKRTDNFKFRSNPFVLLNRGIVNFLPPMTRDNTYRLTSRYSAATQELGEQAVLLDIRYSINKKFKVSFNFSNITDLDNDQLYREIFTEVYYKYKRKWSLKGGVQYQEYNQSVYEVKDEPLLKAVVPYADFLYRFTSRRSLRLEAQYMSTKQDFGSWMFALAEFNINSHWSIVVSDMYNSSPTEKYDKIHYPRFDVFYNFKSNRFGLSYVKQVEGVVCTGGICRLEPAFSGVKFNVTSGF